MHGRPQLEDLVLEPVLKKYTFPYELAYTTSLGQNATVVGENLQKFTSEIARKAMN